MTFCVRETPGFTVCPTCERSQNIHSRIQCDPEVVDDRYCSMEARLITISSAGGLKLCNIGCITISVDDRTPM